MKVCIIKNFVVYTKKLKAKKKMLETFRDKEQ